MQFWKQEAEVICQRMYSPHRAEFCLFSNEHPSKKKKIVYASFLVFFFFFFDKQALVGYVSFQGSNYDPSD